LPLLLRTLRQLDEHLWNDPHWKSLEFARFHASGQQSERSQFGTPWQFAERIRYGSYGFLLECVGLHVLRQQLQLQTICEDWKRTFGVRHQPMR
jgi:hypothetical protein